MNDKTQMQANRDKWIADQQAKLSAKREYTKTCKSCSMAIPKAAKVCPYCRKKQGTSVVSILIASLFGVIMFTFMWTFSSSDKTPSINIQPTIQSQSNAQIDDSKNSKELSQIRINNAVIRIGDTHDSVVDRIPRIATINQVEKKDGDNLIVDRRYRYGGKDFVLTFSNTPPEIIYRVSRILEYDNRP